MDNRKGDKRASFQQLSSLIGIGMVFPLSIVIGYGMGYYLDQWLGTTYLNVVGLLLGIASGFVSFFRMVAAAEREEKADSDSKK
jgi:ATP synthase protein I